MAETSLHASEINSGNYYRVLREIPFPALIPFGAIACWITRDTFGSVGPVLIFAQRILVSCGLLVQAW